MGKFSFAMAFAAVLSSVIPLGTSTVLVKEVARDRRRVGSLLATTLLLRIPLGIVGTLVAFCITHMMRLSYETTLIVLLCAIGAVFGTTNDAVVSALQGLEMLPRQNAVAIIEKLVWAALSIALVFLHGHLWQFAMVGWVSTGIAITFNLSAFAKDLRAALRGVSAAAVGLGGSKGASSIKSLVAMGLPFLGWSLCVTLYGQTDPMVIRFVTGRDVDAGWYSVTTKLVGTTLFLPAALATALLPTLSRLQQDKADEFRALSHRALSIAMLCGIPIAFVLGTMPDRVMAILPYGKRFAEAVPVLRIGGSGLVLWYLGITLGTVVIARDGQKRMLGAAMAAAIMGIPLCAVFAHLTFVHYGNAAIGAITSDCLLEFYLVVRYIQMLPRDAFDWSSFVFAAKCVAAASPMAVFLWYATHLGAGLWVMAPCVLIYVVMCWLLKCVGPQELAMARKLIAKKA
jgi:O-antigen/teichoic acid export membrane protein